MQPNDFIIPPEQLEAFEIPPELMNACKIQDAENEQEADK